jgi:hypothetical protein
MFEHIFSNEVSLFHCLQNTEDGLLQGVLLHFLDLKRMKKTVILLPNEDFVFFLVSVEIKMEFDETGVGN